MASVATSAPVDRSEVRYLHVGIFTDEKVLQLAKLMELLSDQCLQELHQVAAQKSGLRLMPSELQPSSEYGRAFLTGLKGINHWPTDVLQSEVERTRTKWPFVEDLFKYTVIRYLQEVYKHEQPRTISLTLPPLREFIHRYYIEVANNPLTRNLKYFSTFGLEKKNLVIDSVRAALFRVLESQINFQTSVRIESGPLSRGDSLPTPQRRAPEPLRPWDMAGTPVPSERRPARTRPASPNLDAMMRFMTTHLDEAPPPSEKKPPRRPQPQREPPEVEEPPSNPSPVAEEDAADEAIQVEKQQHSARKPTTAQKPQAAPQPGSSVKPGTSTKPPLAGPGSSAKPKPSTKAQPLSAAKPPSAAKPGTSTKPPPALDARPPSVRKVPSARKGPTVTPDPDAADIKTIEVEVDVLPASNKSSPTLFPETEDVPPSDEAVPE